jgi:hypothetical protein
VSTALSIHPSQRLVDIGFGFLYSGALAAAAQLGVADLLEQGPRSAASLAEELQVDVDSLDRALWLLASAGVFSEDEEGRFGLTPAADFLRTRAPGSLRGEVLTLTQKFFWAPAGELAETVRAERGTFERILGKPFFDYLASTPAA